MRKNITRKYNLFTEKKAFSYLAIFKNQQKKDGFTLVYSLLLKHT